MASSVVTVLPRMIAPAERSRATTVASYSGRAAGVQHGTVLGGHVGGVDDVLDAHRQAVQRTDGMTLAAHAVDIARLLERALFVDEGPRLHARLVGADARQATAHQFFGAGASLAHGGDRLRRAERGDVDQIVGAHRGSACVNCRRTRWAANTRAAGRCRRGTWSRTPCPGTESSLGRSSTAARTCGAMPFR